MAQQPAPCPAWPDEWFEHARACLWCGGRDLARAVEGVEDWFFGAVPGAFAFARCASCASLVLKRRPCAGHLASAYVGYYTQREAEPAREGGGLARRIVRAVEAGYARRRYAASGALSDLAISCACQMLPVRRAEVDWNYRHLPRAPADVLDYGCGNGAFLARAAALGHRATGVDFDPQAAAIARRHGVTVHLPGAMADGAFAGRFDHITAAHVLEHVADPLALLADFRRWLKPGGTVFIELPNAEAEGLARHGRFWRGLEAPRHFSLPSAAALRRALEQAGFAGAVIGARAFSRPFMDAASQAAQAAHPGVASGALAGRDAGGPEFLTALARAS
jgi:2-polyprenyl-3-methyl-5-hydroxy-6-metoxy-1,4-benzoquinol methylase